MPNPRTPSQIRTGSYLRPPVKPLTADPALRPALGPVERVPGEESTAFSDWLGHLAAGRIVVR